MATIALKISNGWVKLPGEMQRFARQIPFASAMALNDAVKDAEQAYRKALPRIFDRPTPFTLNSAFVRKATKAHLEASVELRHFAAKGTPADRYLGPEIIGGPRGMKRFERRLDVAGGIGRKFVVPGRAVHLDAYGNVSRGQIMQILSRLNLMGEQNVGPRTTAKLRKQGLLVRHGKRITAGDYFIVHSKNDGGAIGIWQLVSKGKVVPVMIFEREAPHYRPRLDFTGLIFASVRQTFPAHFRKRFAEAVATAR